MSERLAEWLDADYEPFGAHSHYGLVVGENSFQQVADAIRGFLETQPPVARRRAGVVFDGPVASLVSCRPAGALARADRAAFV